MIFPDEYKYIGVTDSLPEDTENNSIYFLTEYLIVEQQKEDGKKFSLYHVQKSGEGLIQKVESFEKLASENQIIEYDRKLNIKNRTLLIETAAKLCKGNINTVIFTGIDNHITFVHKPDISQILEIEVVDVTPPEPSWLSYIIDKLDESELFGDFTVKFSKNLINLKQFEGENTVFPCTVSGLRGKYLDSDTVTQDNPLLVGCEISKTIFELRFPELTYSQVNICPFNSDVFTPTKPFIARCCRSEKSGLTTINSVDGVVVHWGASEFDVAEAVKTLIQHIKNKD
ncbi:hypothetical protein [Methanohalobium sp.]|uniref:DUF7714 family protein n=1 Tax=Methanohalobium sp. TaxID=2837493 RepID=UPI0025EE793F|nr:hypothetical protein [Methanohalobium sp.]